MIIDMRYDTVIFDLDGTLLNTLDNLADSVNAALGRNGFPLKTTDEVRHFVGNGVERLIRLCVPASTQEERYKDCLSDFKAHYSGNMRNKTGPYRGITELITRLKENGYKLAVVSNKYDSAVKELCRVYFGVLIDTAIGASDDMAKKPAPDTVVKALVELGSVPGRTVYVGDSEVDAATAKNAGLAFVGVTWGFRSREVLAGSGAEFIIDRPEELLEILSL
jgi:phosphoglycolate phosphatase